jgi:glutamate-1-semialdehyde 2,1-aminomutase
MGLVPPGAGFLEFLREVASASGALLVFDEVITGFRVSRGGAQERSGITPDLTILGKVIGGGLPAAAYAGPRTFMQMVAPAGSVYQAGTLSGNPLAVAAGLATLNLLDDAAYLKLEQTTRAVAQGLSNAAAEAGVPAKVTWAPGLLTLFFGGGEISDLESVRACDMDAHAAFCRAMLDHGVYLPPSQYEAWFPSLAHDEEHLELTLDAAARSFAEIAG